MTSTVRVLHVDDDPEFADLTAEFLEREREHFEVLTEYNATDALSCLDTESVDCIVSDYQMPRTDGLELLDTVRDDYPDLPFILFTNQGSEQIAAEAIETGVTSYLQKETGGTVQYTMLANRIQNHVEKYRAEHRARTAQQEYEHVAETATDVFWTVELPDETMAFSDGIKHFGYDAAVFDREVDLNWLFDRVHPDDRERLREHHERLLDREETAFDELQPERGEFSNELRFERADGTYADCRGRGIVLFDGGEPTKIVGTMTDLSEQTERERELGETTRELEAIIEASPDAIILVDEEGVVQRWNPAAERLFGWTAEEIVSERLPAVPPEEEAIVDEIRDQLLGENPDPITGYETQRQRKDGSVIDVSVSTAPVQDTRDDVTGVVAVVEDISDRKAAERDRQRERDRLQALIENTPDPIMAVSFEDGSPLIDAVNPAFETTFGIDAEAAVGRTVADTVVPEEAHDEHERLKDRVFHGEPVETEVRRVTDSGIREFALRIIPIDVDDVSSGAYAWYTDITERKERERELERITERFRAFTEHASDLISVVDETGVFQYHSPSVEQILGYDQEELVGENAFEYIHPDDRDQVWEAFVEMIEHPETVTRKVEFRFEHADGSWVWLETVASNDTETTIEGYVTTSRDITDRKAREQELQRVKERFQRVFEQSNDANMIVDIDCETFVEVNRAACEMLGYPREELLALNPDDIHPDDIDRIREEFLSEVYETGTGWTEDVTCVTKDGEEIPTEISGAKLQLDTDTDEGEDGSPKMVAVLRDISEQVAYEQELERQNERLETLVNTVSHDLRNPLNVADGRLALALEDCDSEHLSVVADSLTRMETLIEDLLTLARQGKTPAELETLNLADIVENSWQNVDTCEAILRLDAEGTVRADRSRLMQLFENLIRNSVEHGGEDVAVTVGTFDEGFYVTDDGPGIDPDDRDQVFDSGYSTSADGTGFGLSIVKEIVEAHGWNIRVTDSDSGGARFEISDCTAPK